MADNMMRIAGRDLTGLAKSLSVEVDENGNGVLRVIDANPWAYDSSSDEIKVRAKPRSRTKVVLFDAVSVRDTVPLTSAIIDTTNIAKATILIASTLNQPVVIRFLEVSTTSTFGRGCRDATPTFLPLSLSVKEAETIIITPAEWSVLGGVMPDFRIQTQSSIAPTEGALTVVLLHESR